MIKAACINSRGMLRPGASIQLQSIVDTVKSRGSDKSRTLTEKIGLAEATTGLVTCDWSAGWFFALHEGDTMACQHRREIPERESQPNPNGAGH